MGVVVQAVSGLCRADRREENEAALPRVAHLAEPCGHHPRGSSPWHPWRADLVLMIPHAGCAHCVLVMQVSYDHSPDFAKEWMDTIKWCRHASMPPAFLCFIRSPQWRAPHSHIAGGHPHGSTIASTLAAPGLTSQRP